MSNQTASTVFIFFIVLSAAIRLWLNFRQATHVRANRGAVPAEFAAGITLEEHQKNVERWRAIEQAKTGLAGGG